MFRDQGIRHVTALALFSLLFLCIQGKKEELKTGGYIMAGSNEGLSNRLRCDTFCFLLEQKNVFIQNMAALPQTVGRIKELILIFIDTFSNDTYYS
jgi:hypothetical protein